MVVIEVQGKVLWVRMKWVNKRNDFKGQEEGDDEIGILYGIWDVGVERADINSRHQGIRRTGLGY